MRLADYISKLRRVSKELSNQKRLRERVTFTAALATEAEFKIRIFRDGKDSKGNDIGDYSTKPMYVNPATLTGLPKGRFRPLGQNGKSRFKNGKQKVSRYLPNGYKELRQRAGRQAKKVDLNLTGTSERTIKTGLKNNRVVIGYTDPKREEILKANEDRFSANIFTLSKKERAYFQQQAVKEIQAILKEVL